METEQLWRQYLIAGIANIGMTTAGFAMGWTSPVNLKLGNLTTSPLPVTLAEDSEEVAWIGSLLSIGGIFGPFIAGFAVTHIGRKWGLLASTIPMFIGWILIAAATNVALMYSGRVMWGLAVGMMYTISPMYCAEIATDDSRGALASLLLPFLCIGLLLVNAIGPYVSYSVIAYVGVSLVAVFAVTFFFMPESPTYYLLKNDRESAARCLARIRGRSVKGVESELSNMEVKVKESQEKSATLQKTDEFRPEDSQFPIALGNLGKPASIFGIIVTHHQIMDVFRGGNLKAFYISTVLVTFQQLSAVNIVIAYLSTIFNAAGYGLDAAIAAIIVSTVQVAASFMMSFVVDRLGRKILLLISSCGTAVGLGLLGMYFLLDELESPAAQTLGWLPVPSLMLFITTHSWGLGPLPWAIMSELFSIEVKAIAVPMATAWSWILSFLVIRYFSSLTIVLGMYTAFWIFGLCCVGCFFFTLFFVPETKGKSFQEIQVMLSGGKFEEREKA